MATDRANEVSSLSDTKIRSEKLYLFVQVGAPKNKNARPKIELAGFTGRLHKTGLGFLEFSHFRDKFLS